MNDYGDTESGPGGIDRIRWFKEAQARVRMPGFFLQLYGIALVLIGTAMAGASLMSSKELMDAYYDWVEDMQKQQPPEERQKLPPRDDAVKSLQIEGPVYGFILLAAGVFIFIGGSKMKELRGYGWSMVGAVLACFPGMCCCCVGLIPGIWALVVLMNSDVKLAFAKVSAPPRERGVADDSASG